MNVLTSYMCINAEEGTRITYTFSTLDQDGNITAQNQRGNFVVLDQNLKEHLNAIADYLKARIG